ncbi:MAG: sugar nucleotide-binding protein [Puniceicoccales bacterium]|jgi:dTDP-4-dehydrorhamnose reductase|nr:sugar nucleotide-binding protein [Puniceicoccales bacterium]
MKIVITGASGFLGREVALSAIRRGHGVVAIGGSRRVPVVHRAVRTANVDLGVPQNLERLLLDEFPDAIVNCAALTTVEACAAAPELAAKLNTDLPRFLAMMAQHFSARLIHVSTDEVFNGEQGNYAHTDTPTPAHLLGETKLAGEKEVLAHGKFHAVALRVPLISGNSVSGLHALHERLVARWAQGEVTALSPTQIRQPVDVSNLADAMVELCERDNLSGVYHWAGTEALSLHEIGRRVAAHFELTSDRFVTSAESDAVRVHDLSLDLHPLRGKLKTRAQTFSEILSQMQMPSQFADWHAAQIGRTAVRCFVRGVDF